MEQHEAQFKIVFRTEGAPTSPGAGGSSAPPGSSIVPGLTPAPSAVPGAPPIDPGYGPASPGSPSPPGPTYVPPGGHVPAPVPGYAPAPGTPGTPGAPGVPAPSAPVPSGGGSPTSVGPVWTATIGATVTRTVGAADRAAATYGAATSAGLYDLTIGAAESTAKLAAAIPFVPEVPVRAIESAARAASDYGPGVLAALGLPETVVRAAADAAQGVASFRNRIVSAGVTLGQVRDVAVAQSVLAGRTDTETLSDFGADLYAVNRTLADFESARRIRNAQRAGAAVNDLAARAFRDALDQGLSVFGGR